MRSGVHCCRSCLHGVIFRKILSLKTRRSLNSEFHQIWYWSSRRILERFSFYFDWTILTVTLHEAVHSLASVIRAHAQFSPRSVVALLPWVWWTRKLGHQNFVANQTRCASYTMRVFASLFFILMFRYLNHGYTLYVGSCSFVDTKALTPCTSHLPPFACGQTRRKHSTCRFLDIP